MDWMFDEDREIETTETIDDTLIFKHTPHRKNMTALKKERLAQVVTSLPAPGESWHIVSNATYDYFSFVPVVCDLVRAKGIEFYGSTWTMSRNNVLELLALFDNGALASIGVLTGTYFKRRESSVYATLLDGLEERKQRFVAFQNHAKILLMGLDPYWIVAEGSANFTANPRLEQYVISNDRELYGFHKEWMEKILK